MKLWARYAENAYECSSHGDKRFSALFAKLKDGRTIEEAYQLDIKGYRCETDDWQVAKGKPPLKNQDCLYDLYKQLWIQYLEENPYLLDDLVQKSDGKVLTDKFANTSISQARALAEIINEVYLPKGFGE